MAVLFGSRNLLMLSTVTGICNSPKCHFINDYVMKESY